MCKLASIYADVFFCKLTIDDVITRSEGPETLRLYLMVLDLQNKHAELLALLQEDADLKFREDSPLIPFDLERDRIKIKAHLALEQWHDTAS